MKEYNEILDSIRVAEMRDKAEAYFEKYWLDKDEYFEKWLPIQNSIFDSRAEFLPDMMFNNGFELYPLVGGGIFVSQQDYQCLQNCMEETGDKNFVVVQNKKVFGGPFTRFRYKVDDTWDELMSGGFFGTEHFNNPCKDYFVFGDSANWGRYVGTSWIVPGNRFELNPLNIMGFKKEYSDVFRKNFDKVRLLEPQITPEILFSEWLPDSYKQPSVPLG